MYYIFKYKYDSVVHVIDEESMKDFFTDHSILDYQTIYKDKDFVNCLNYCMNYMEDARCALDSSAPSAGGR